MSLMMINIITIFCHHQAQQDRGKEPSIPFALRAATTTKN